MGIVEGIVCDNQLADAEVRFLARWLDANKQAAAAFPGSIIARRVSEVLSDGILTDDEKTKLLADLKMLSTADLMDAVPELPAHIAAAFAKAPVVEIPSKLFVLTGEFLFGSRPICERAIMKRGGSVGSSVSGRTNYVVVGGNGYADLDRAELPAQDSASRRTRQVRSGADRGNPRIRLGRGAELTPPAAGTGSPFLRDQHLPAWERPEIVCYANYISGAWPDERAQGCGDANPPRPHQIAPGIPGQRHVASVAG
jgi:hypothetical protein